MKPEQRARLGLKREPKPKQDKAPTPLAVDFACLARELHAIASRDDKAAADGPLRARELNGASAAALAKNYGITDPLALASLARRKAEQPPVLDPRVQVKLDAAAEEKARRKAEIAKLAPFDARSASADAKKARWREYGVNTAAGTTPLAGGGGSPLTLGPTQDPDWHGVRHETPAEARQKREARAFERVSRRVEARMTRGPLDWKKLPPAERRAYKALLQKRHGLGAPTSYPVGGAAPGPRPPRKVKPL